MKNSNTGLQQDSVQQRLVEYATVITGERIPPAALDAARLRIIDTLGVLIGGFSDEGCRMARALAASAAHEVGWLWRVGLADVPGAAGHTATLSSRIVTA